MHEFINNYQSKSDLVGVERSLLLQKVISAGVAYSCPVVQGSMDDVNNLYRQMCLPNAIKIVSKVNEQMLVNVDEVLADIQLLWCGRYEQVNSPLSSTKVSDFHKSLTTFATDISVQYEYWVTQSVLACSSIVNQGEVK